MAREAAVLPDGSEFPFWDDETRYAKTYHVACGHPRASDANPGTEDRPFATISAAAAVLNPGERVLVHGGTYRECVRPARGGDGPDRMIAYEAAPGEEVIVKGSQVWRPDLRPSEGWDLRSSREGIQVWMADLPAEWFQGYNPFLATNVFGELMTFIQAWSTVEMHRLQRRRGMIFLNGQPLHQVFRFEHLAEREAAFWVEDPGLRIHMRLPAGTDPAGVSFEVTTREQVFAPTQRRLGYLKVKGFRFEHAADGIPVPQRAAVSASQGHHWIIEDNSVRFANACGIDIGAQHWSMADYEPCGHHILRRNRISDCGVCGVAGVGKVDYTLVEDNLVQRIGGRDIERLFECAGMKFHVAKGMLIRRNLFRHIRHANGLWLDYLNENCRVSGNVFADISSLSSAVYLEVSHAPNLIDHNVIWDVRGEPFDKGDPTAPITGGHGIRADSCEYAIVAHNLVGKVAHGFALYLGTMQDQREVGGRTGLARRQKVLNNIVVASPRRLCFGRADDNVAEGNLYDAGHDRVSFVVETPPPKSSQNLRGWQEFYGFDRSSTQATLAAELDPQTRELSLHIKGPAPRPAEVEPLRPEGAPTVGPFDADTWADLAAGKPVKVRLRAGPPGEA